MTEAVIIIETSLLICYANQWTGFCMITASVTKDFKASGNLALKFKGRLSNINGTVKFILSLYLDLYSLNYRVHYLTQQKLLGNNFPLESKKRVKQSFHINLIPIKI